MPYLFIVLVILNSIYLSYQLLTHPATELEQAPQVVAKQVQWREPTQPLD